MSGSSVDADTVAPPPYKAVRGRFLAGTVLLELFVLVSGYPPPIIYPSQTRRPHRMERSAFPSVRTAKESNRKFHAANISQLSLRRMGIWGIFQHFIANFEKSRPQGPSPMENERGRRYGSPIPGRCGGTVHKIPLSVENFVLRSSYPAFGGAARSLLAGRRCLFGKNTGIIRCSR